MGIYLTTVVTIVVADLLSGVLLGIGLAAAKLLYTFSHLETLVEPEREQSCLVLKLRGAATFVRLPQLAAALEDVRPAADDTRGFTQLAYHLLKLSSLLIERNVLPLATS